MANTEDGPVILGERNGVLFWVDYEEPGKRFTHARATMLANQLDQDHASDTDRWLFRIRVVARKRVPFRMRLRAQKERAIEKALDEQRMAELYR